MKPNTELELAKVSTPFSSAVLRWYDANARILPWRIPPDETKTGVLADPYKVWLSEIMLQQTQIATVIPYFHEFLKRWPDLTSLAAAPLDDVLTVWAGLGYYSRARNLKACSEILVAEHGGQFPEDAPSLKKLPGIGEYTAAAIAAIAFGKPEAVVDGNIERVVCRYRKIATPIPKAKMEVRVFLETVLDQKRPGDFAQAMMDLGANVCTQRNPSCNTCPLSAGCKAWASGNPEQFPVKKAKPAKPTRKGAAFVIENTEGELFLCKRPPEGLLAGMTQVPTSNWTAAQDGGTGIDNAPFASDWQYCGTIRHTFTHFHLELEIWRSGRVDCGLEIDGWWCAKPDLSNQALPTVMRKAIAQGMRRFG